MVTRYIGTERINLLDIKESAEALGLCTKTMYSFANKGIIPHCRLQGKIYFTDKNLSRFLRGAQSIRRKEIVKAPEYETDNYPPDAWESP